MQSLVLLLLPASSNWAMGATLFAVTGFSANLFGTLDTTAGAFTGISDIYTQLNDFGSAGLSEVTSGLYSAQYGGQEFGAIDPTNGTIAALQTADLGSNKTLYGIGAA